MEGIRSQEGVATLPAYYPYAQMPADKEISLWDYWHVLQKRIWVVIAVFVLGVGSVALYLFLARPIYRATARIMVDPRNPQLLNGPSLYDTRFSMNFYETQKKLLTSYRIVKAAFDKLPAIDRARIRLRSGRPVEALRHKVAVQLIRRSRIIDISAEDPDPDFTARLANAVVDAYIQFELHRRRHTGSKALEILQHEQKKLEEEIRVSTQRLQHFRESSKVPFFSTNRDNNIMLWKLERLTSRLTATQLKLFEVENTLALLEQLFPQITHQPKLVDGLALSQVLSALAILPETSRLMDSYLLFLEQQNANAMQQMYKSRYTQEFFRQHPSQWAYLQDENNGYQNDYALASLRRELSNAQVQYRSLANEFTPQHPNMIALADKIKQLQQEIAAAKERLEQSKQTALDQKVHVSRQVYQQVQAFTEAEKRRILKFRIQETVNRRRILREQVNKLNNLVHFENQKALEFSKRFLQYQKMEEEDRWLRQLYTTIHNRIKEIDLSELKENTVTNITVIDKALPPNRPVKPRKRLALVLACLFFSLLGCAAAFLVEYLDTRFQSTREVEEFLGFHVLGTVSTLKSSQGEDIYRYIIERPNSAVSEAFQIIRNNALSTAKGQVHRIMVTSASHAEGKTFVALSLAVTLAKHGEGTLLVEADMRLPKFNRIFGWDHELSGLSSLTADISPTLQGIQALEDYESLRVLPSGQRCPTPNELLSSHQMKTLVQHLSKEYEYIVFDFPPVLGLPDTLSFTQNIDGVILVVNIKKSDKSKTRHAAQLLARAGLTVIGVVLNEVEPEKSSYYYGYGYYDHYLAEEESKNSLRF